MLTVIDDYTQISWVGVCGLQVEGGNLNRSSAELGLKAPKPSLTATYSWSEATSSDWTARSAVNPATPTTERY
ncbi:MAG: hypothetical protein AAGI48_13625 [Verrucomicrobiota bacterium]